MKRATIDLNLAAAQSPASILGRRKRALFSTFTLLGIAYAFYRGYLFPLTSRLRHFDAWQTGDWLIDYSGGLVRRGISGQVISLFASDGSAAITIVVALQTTLAALLFMLVATLYLLTDRSAVWTMLVLSPSFLLFLALDPLGNGRKELLVLVGLAIAALGVRVGKPELGLWLAFPIFLLSVFVHEALVVTLPAFLYLIFKSASMQRAWRITAAYGAAGVAGVSLALLRPGSRSVAEQICAAWKAREINDCGGALAALGTPIATEALNLYSLMFPAYWAYLVPGALALIPFFVLRFLPGEWVVVMLITLATIPLFLVAWDYGRWIFLIAAQLSIISLSQARSLQPMNLPMYGAVAYVLLWGFEHVGQPASLGLGIRWLASVFS